MSEPQRTQPALVVLGLALVVYAAFSQFKLPVVLPVLLDTYSYGRVLAGGFMSIFAVFGILLSVPIGRLVARRGALRLVMAALPVMGLGTAVCLLAPESGTVMLIGRGLEGAAFATLAVAGPALATANAAPQHRALVIGLIAAWVPSGQLLATLIGPLALNTTGWQGLWWVCLLLAAALVGWTFIMLRSGPRGTTRRADTGAAPAPAWTRAQWLSLLLVGCTFMLWTGQYLAYMTWLPAYLVEVQGLAVDSALYGYLVPVVLVGVFNVTTGILMQRGRKPQHLLFGAVVIQAGIWWLLPVTGSGWSGLASLVVYGVTSGIAPTCLFALSAHLVANPNETARAFGVAMTGRNLGVLGGPLLLALAVELSGGWLAGSLLFAGVTTLAVVVSALLLFIVPRVEAHMLRPALSAAG
ncbi:MFS transporter [Pelagibius marinus]|uniref:MFS transporter n=1 Tax=Pelagibius marinus TaxID=2762760 RepID=UPI001872A5BF|nr:MFS transporter [Pelagibius marinus]